jgi:hypothetical protein
MKTMEVYLIKNMPGREFTHVLKNDDSIECYISWKYKKELNKRPLTEIIVIEADDLNMLGNIVKKMSGFIEKIESPNAEYLNSILNRV